MSGDQGLISYESFSQHEFLMVRNIMDERVKITKEIKKRLDEKR